MEKCFVDQFDCYGSIDDFSGISWVRIPLKKSAFFSKIQTFFSKIIYKTIQMLFKTFFVSFRKFKLISKIHQSFIEF
jgi:hypothetical protein